MRNNVNGLLTIGLDPASQSKSNSFQWKETEGVRICHSDFKQEEKYLLLFAKVLALLPRRDFFETLKGKKYFNFNSTNTAQIDKVIK
jgi:hypothetical protein